MYLAAWLTDMITVATVSGNSAYGDPMFNAQVTIPARVETVKRLVRDSKGQETISDTRVLTQTKINETDRIWLPGANTGDANASNVPLSVHSSKTKAGGATVWEILL